MQELLERLGCRIRGRRCSCPYCPPSKDLDVSFTDEVAYCHKCRWTANVRTLQRQLGIALEPESLEAIRRRQELERFKEWRDACEYVLTHYHRRLQSRARLAHIVLGNFPDLDSAWEALRRYANEDAGLAAALEILNCEREPMFTDEPWTPDRLLAVYRAGINVHAETAA